MTSEEPRPPTADAVRRRVAAAILKDPAILYERLHGGASLSWSEQGRCWTVVGPEPARLILRDERFRMPGPDPESVWAAGREHGRFLQSLVLSAEGADHARLRRALSPAFSPRAVRRRREPVRAATADLLTDLDGAATFDAVAAVSSRLPVAVVGDLVGVPPAERRRASRLCIAISQGGGLASGRPTDPAVATATDALAELTELVPLWLEQAEPDSVLGNVADARGEKSALSDTELVAGVFSLYLAGHDTSRNLLSAVLLALATDAGLLERVRAEPAVAASCVERVLLRQSPLTFTVREATEDVNVDGTLVRRGDRLRVMLGAANHALLASTTGRPDAPGGVAFGEGRHVCLGAHVARLEGEVLLEVAAERWSSVRLTGEPRWSPHFLHRGLQELPLAVTW